MPIRIIGERPPRPPYFDTPSAAIAFLDARISDVEALRIEANMAAASVDQLTLYRRLLLRHGTCMGLLSMAYSARLVDDTAYDSLHNRLLLTLLEKVQ